jgi:hypothetical protein
LFVALSAPPSFLTLGFRNFSLRGNFDMSLEADMMRGLAQMNYSAEMSSAAQVEFHEACCAFDWTKADELRQKAMAAFEAHLDVMMSVHKRLEMARGKQ